MAQIWSETGTWQNRYMERFYLRRPGWRDGTAEFHDLCAEVIPQGCRILEIGSGPANKTSSFLASHGVLDGIDVDPIIERNEFVRRSFVIKDNEYPIESESVDACVSNYVCEHIERPELHMREVWRVLKPGGVYALRTPNLIHYVSLISWLTPQWFHKLVANRLRALPREAHEPWPTCYRMNSRNALRALARDAGFEIELLRMVEKEPSYGMVSPFLFVPFMWYERLVNCSEVLAGFRSNVFAVLRKPVQAQAACK